MNKHKETPHGYHKQEKHTKHGPPTTSKANQKAIHKDWRLWAAVGLMLAAIIGYVVSLDESLRPGGDGQTVPANVEAE